MSELKTRLIVAMAAVFTFTVVTPVVYMLADTLPPYEYDAEGSYVIPELTKPDRQMLVHWRFKTINRLCEGSITRSIVDAQTGVVISYDPTAAARNVRKSDTGLDRTFYLPPGISPGVKWYYADGEFACNIVQRFFPLRVRTPRLRFEVLPEPDGYGRFRVP